MIETPDEVLISLNRIRSAHRGRPQTDKFRTEPADRVNCNERLVIVPAAEGHLD